MNLGRDMIKAGADMVVGHGSHMLQEIEYYKGKWIIYSLGNYVFATPGRYDKLDGFPYSMALQAEFTRDSGELEDLKLFPFKCDNSKTDYQATLCTEKEMKKVKKKLTRLMDEDDGDRKRIKTKENDVGWYFDLKH